MFGTMDAHLISPSEASEDRALRNHLIPVRAWVNLTHADTFIHGPFDFALVRNRKTRDQIDQTAWDAVACRSDSFQNKVPRFDIPTFSVHVDIGVHIILRDAIPVGDAFTYVEDIVTVADED